MVVFMWYFKNPFFLVSLSPWPLLLSLMIMNYFISVIMWFSFNTILFMFINMIGLMMICMLWWRDIIRESTLMGFHTMKIIYGLKLSMILFITSEIFFFFSIFWCYFHMFLSPSIEIGMNWPPMNIKLFNPYLIPLLNTMILLSSGISVSWCHYSLLMMNKKNSLISLLITIILGILFTLLQLLEYKESMFSFSDSVFGSIFFMSTGFHGFHVLAGTMFLMVSLIRMYKDHYSSYHHLGFEMAVWYWHFVDLIWLFLYLLVYYWIY